MAEDGGEDGGSGGGWRGETGGRRPAGEAAGHRCARGLRPASAAWLELPVVLDAQIGLFLPSRRLAARVLVRASITGIVHEPHWHHGPVAVYFIRATCGTSQPGHIFCRGKCGILGRLIQL